MLSSASFRKVALSALLIPFVVPSAPASTQDVVPGVSSELVQLDAVVTDAKGQIVRGLSREDFEVREDGKPQPVVHFMPAGPGSRAPALAGGASSPSPVPPGTTVPEAAPPEEAGPGRSIVVVVDDLHISGSNLVSARAALTRLVHELVADSDQVAVVSTGAGLVHPLSRGRAALAQSLNRLTPRDAGGDLLRGAMMTAAEAEMILRGDTAALQLVAKAKSEEPGGKFDSLRGATDTQPVLGMTEADPQEQAAASEAQRHARGVLLEALRYSSATLATVEGVLRGLASQPGREDLPADLGRVPGRHGHDRGTHAGPATSRRRGDALRGRGVCARQPWSRRHRRRRGNGRDPGPHLRGLRRPAGTCRPAGRDPDARDPGAGGEQHRGFPRPGDERPRARLAAHARRQRRVLPHGLRPGQQEARRAFPQDRGDAAAASGLRRPHAQGLSRSSSGREPPGERCRSAHGADERSGRGSGHERGRGAGNPRRTPPGPGDPGAPDRGLPGYTARGTPGALAGSHRRGRARVARGRGASSGHRRARRRFLRRRRPAGGRDLLSPERARPDRARSGIASWRRDCRSRSACPFRRGAIR